MYFSHANEIDEIQRRLKQKTRRKDKMNKCKSVKASPNLSNFIYLLMTMRIRYHTNAHYIIFHTKCVLQQLLCRKSYLYIDVLHCIIS